MTNNFFKNIVCAAVALIATTLSFAEVTSVQSVDFEYGEAGHIVLEA